MRALLGFVTPMTPARPGPAGSQGRPRAACLLASVLSTTRRSRAAVLLLAHRASAGFGHRQCSPMMRVQPHGGPSGAARGGAVRSGGFLGRSLYLMYFPFTPRSAPPPLRTRSFILHYSVYLNVPPALPLPPLAISPLTFFLVRDVRFFFSVIVFFFNGQAGVESVSVWPGDIALQYRTACRQLDHRTRTREFFMMTSRSRGSAGWTHCGHRPDRACLSDYVTSPARLVGPAS